MKSLSFAVPIALWMLATLAGLGACTTAAPLAPPPVSPAAAPAPAPAAPWQGEVITGNRKVKDVKVTILSDMAVSQRTIAEWGFSALVEIVTDAGQTQRILFDTGANPRTVLENAARLKVDLTGIQHVILSHNHGDHTMGLNTLRAEYAKKDAATFRYAHVGGEEIFWPRPSADGGDDNVMVEEGPKYRAQGGQFVVHSKPRQIFPGVWLTGQVPRAHAEKNWSVDAPMRTPKGELVEDTIPEDMSLVFDTDRGLVVLTGCGHAGIVNILRHATAMTGNPVVHAVLGGLHLFKNVHGDEEGQLDWTARMMRGYNMKYLLGAHCTGFERVHYLGDRIGLPRGAAVISTIGTVFDLTSGITGSALNRQVP